jgi:Tfp pilus assembly protein PilX
MKKAFIGLLILTLCALVQSAYGAAGDVANINGKAITAVASVSGKANAGILTIAGKPCSDGDTGTCTGATNQLESFVANGEANFASASTNLWRASEIVYAGTTGTACKLVANLNCTTTDCTAVITGYIYSNDPTGDGGAADGVGTVVGTCTGTYDSTPLTADDTDIDLTSCSGTLTNGSKYWIITKSDGYNGTNYFKLGNDSTCTTEKIAYSGDGTTWTYATGNCNTFKLYILE